MANIAENIKLENCSLIIYLGETILECKISIHIANVVV